MSRVKNRVGLPRLRTLSADELIEISRMPLNFDYNFAEPPAPAIRWGLAELLDHARFPMARTDACDKWGCPCLSLDNYFRFISERTIAEPGSLSAVTVAKVIAYCLEIVEATAEAIRADGRGPDLTGEGLVEEIGRLRDLYAGQLKDLSPWWQFHVGVRHPVVRYAINNALMNRWGARGYPPDALPGARGA
ncbi:MAG: hypothetical protein JO069_20200 [Verrucomicrobia bacterium]|nr:hypothetical protein [Verrucomicrobiota bacterium]